jgi:HEAT repeat protein
VAKSIHRLLERIRNRDIKATIELLEIKDPSTIPELLDALGDENDYVRSYASLALSCYCMSEVKLMLQKLLKSPNGYARAKAIDTLILMKAKEMLPDIILLENDPNMTVQISVQRARKLLG